MGAAARTQFITDSFSSKKTLQIIGVLISLAMDAAAGAQMVERDHPVLVTVAQIRALSAELAAR